MKKAATYRWGARWFTKHDKDIHPAWQFIRSNGFKEGYVGREGLLEWANINYGVKSLLLSNEGYDVIGLKFRSEEDKVTFLSHVPEA